MAKLEIKRIQPVTLILLAILVILVIIVSAIFYFLFPVIKTTGLYQGINKYYQENRWVTYTSARAHFSFSHPLMWPVAAESDLELKRDNADAAEIQWGSKLTYYENIDFNEKWYRNAGGERLGSISVKKLEGVNSLQDYLNEENLLEDRYEEIFIKGITQKIFFPAPVLEYTKIGGVDAVKITEKPNGLASFSRTTNDYRLYRNGLIYRFTTIDSSRFSSDKDKNTEIFNKIIQSIKFID